MNSYSFPSKTFEKVWKELRIWRNRMDYEEHLKEEIKPLIENEKSLSLSVKLILLKKLEGIIKWLKIMV